MNSSLVRAIAIFCAFAGLSQARDDMLFLAAERSRDAFLRTLEELVSIDTGTGDVEGMTRAADMLAAQLSKLGGDVTRPSAAPAARENLVAKWRGRGPGKILLIAHLDTVFKSGTAKERPFKITDSRASGPGVADDKSGVVAGLFAVRILRELKFTEFAELTFIVNTNEETGSFGARRLIEAEGRKHDVVFNLEPGRAGDKVLQWRKGSAIVDVTVVGKSAHAGTAPETGRNAALELAHQIVQMSALGDSAKRTTVNFTVLGAGDRFNVIPDRATARGDVRALTEDEFVRVEKNLREMAQSNLVPDVQVDVRFTRGFPPLAPNAATDRLIAKAQAIYAELGLTLGAEGTGGAGDASFTAAIGIPTLDALGIAGGNAHTDQEYLDLNTLVPRLYLLCRLIMDHGRGRP
jgi:glutamate carboxypeptidase